MCSGKQTAESDFSTTAVDINSIGISGPQRNRILTRFDVNFHSSLINLKQFPAYHGDIQQHGARYLVNLGGLRHTYPEQAGPFEHDRFLPEKMTGR